MVYYSFSDLVKLFKQKQFSSACILTSCVGLSLQTKDCFKVSGLLVTDFFVGLSTMQLEIATHFCA